MTTIRVASATTTVRQSVRASEPWSGVPEPSWPRSPRTFPSRLRSCKHDDFRMKLINFRCRRLSHTKRTHRSIELSVKVRIESTLRGNQLSPSKHVWHDRLWIRIGYRNPRRGSAIYRTRPIIAVPPVKWHFLLKTRLDPAVFRARPADGIAAIPADSLLKTPAAISRVNMSSRPLQLLGRKRNHFDQNGQTESSQIAHQTVSENLNGNIPHAPNPERISRGYTAVLPMFVLFLVIWATTNWRCYRTTRFHSYPSYRLCKCFSTRKKRFLFLKIIFISDCWDTTNCNVWKEIRWPVSNHWESCEYYTVKRTE